MTCAIVDLAVFFLNLATKSRGPLSSNPDQLRSLPLDRKLNSSSVSKQASLTVRGIFDVVSINFVTVY